MRRKTRSYLTQLSEPVPPSQLVLAVRHGIHARSGVGLSDLPVIQDENAVAPKGTTLTREEASRRQQTTPVAIPPDRLPAAQPLSPSPGQPDGTVAHARAPADAKARVSREDIVIQPKTTHRRAHDSAPEPNPVPLRVTAKEASPESGPVQREAVASPGGVPSFSPPAAGMQPKVPFAAQAESVKPPALPVMGPMEKVRAADAKDVQFGSETARFTSSKEEAAKSVGSEGMSGPRLHELMDTRGNEGTTVSGTRVRIGTVEVRNIISQPAVTQPAQVAPQPVAETAGPRGTGPRTAEPLARPLAWSFGLVQG